MTMQMQSLEDLIDAEHPARTIWQVTAALDLARFYAAIKARAGTVGRDPTDPRLLIALWLYATTDGVGSARELARLCTESNPYRWLCGGVTLNHHTLSDFRVTHVQALDELFTQVIVSLVRQKLVSVYRISQDGTRVRACCGTSSLRRKDRLNTLLAEARSHVKALRQLLEDPEQSALLGARKKAAMQRAATEREARIEQAIKQLPKMEARQAKLARSKSEKEKERLREPRASTTDAEARVMKMGDGGFRPALNVQIASDPVSRAIVGIDVINTVDTEQLEPMRRQVEKRTGGKVHEHLADGGYLTTQDVQTAPEQKVTLYMPPRPPRNPEKFGDEFTPRESDSDEVNAWRARMGTENAKMIYKQRAATSETINADLKAHRGLGLPLNVRGIEKVRCIALWCALAYNLLHFGRQLIG